MPSTVARAAHPPVAGLTHVAFTFGSLRELADAYVARRARGISPSWCVNHGPTTSMYYRDPDGNEIEAQTWNFEHAEDVDAFLESVPFKENPIGTDFDPEKLVRRLQSGRSLKLGLGSGQSDGVPLTFHPLSPNIHCHLSALNNLLICVHQLPHII